MVKDTDTIELSKQVAVILSVLNEIRDDVKDIITNQKDHESRLRALELDQSRAEAWAAESASRESRLREVERAQGAIKARLDSFDRRMTVWGALCAVVAAVVGTVTSFLRGLWPP